MAQPTTLPELIREFHSVANQSRYRVIRTPFTRVNDADMQPSARAAIMNANIAIASGRTVPIGPEEPITFFEFTDHDWAMRFAQGRAQFNYLREHVRPSTRRRR